MENSKIEWTDHTFNPWIGCTNVSEGCDNCYAELMAQRYGWVQWGKGQARHLTSESNWKKPIAWDAEAARKRTRYRVFCASLADVMDLEVPNDWRDKLWDLIARTPNLDWLLLTKRPQHFRRFLPWIKSKSSPWRNVWLGTTTENQKRFNERVKIIAETPAAVRFLSMEPLLGKIDVYAPKSADGTALIEKIDWAILGGESGPGSREMKVGWVLDIIEACRAADVAVFVKQMGAKHDLPNRLKSRKGGEIGEWPIDLRIRELPAR